MLRWLILGLLLLAPGRALAEWREASTRHFVIYADQTEAELRKTASDLEKYDNLLRLTLGVPMDSPIRLKIYLMRDMGAVQAAYGDGGPGVAGFYRASPRGPIAVGLRGDTGSYDYDLSSQSILFHEYAHHLMLQYFPGVFPAWYVEGFAEYYGSTRIMPGNVIEVGHHAKHRRLSFTDSRWLNLKRLLTARRGDDYDGKFDLVYAEGWLLVHYLNNGEQRAGQLRKYLAAINRGVDWKRAMDDAFGPDAAELDQELRRYSRRSRLDALRISFPPQDEGPIAIRLLSGAEAALIRHDIMLSRGITAREAEEFADGLRKTAGRFPADPHALALQAEAELLAGRRAEASAMLARWLALRPSDPRALALKSRIAAAELVAAKSQDKAAWDAARVPVAAARKAAPSDPFVLDAYYDSFADQGILPPARAQNALFAALELVPQDNSLRYKVAADFERRGLIEPAIAAIRPAAFASHAPEDEDRKLKARREKAEEKNRKAGEAKSESPREMLARLESRLKGGPAEPPAAPAPPSPSARDELPYRPGTGS